MLPKCHNWIRVDINENLVNFIFKIKLVFYKK
jgi:hypothetical protein